MQKENFMKNDIALVCVAKDEDHYLQEWIDYHLMLGFDSIHVYQNNWRFNKPIEDSRVHFHKWDYHTHTDVNKPIWEFNLQAKCYTHFSRTYHKDYKWGAFFDVDEFLVLKETNNVKEFISKYDDYNCLIINWAMFGDNDHKIFDPNDCSVIERFTKRWDQPHKDNVYMFKSICKLHSEMNHMIHWDGGEWVDPDYNVGNAGYNLNFNYDKAQLNHYYVKTYVEWCNKIRRNDVDMPTALLESYDDYNFNDVEDLKALNLIKDKVYE
jgi:hypothetical protein